MGSVSTSKTAIRSDRISPSPRSTKGGDRNPRPAIRTRSTFPAKIWWLGTLSIRTWSSSTSSKRSRISPSSVSSRTNPTGESKPNRLESRIVSTSTQSTSRGKEETGNGKRKIGVIIENFSIRINLYPITLLADRSNKSIANFQTKGKYPSAALLVPFRQIAVPHPQL